VTKWVAASLQEPVGSTLSTERMFLPLEKTELVSQRTKKEPNLGADIGKKSTWDSRINQARTGGGIGQDHMHRLLSWRRVGTILSMVWTPDPTREEGSAWGKTLPGSVLSTGRLMSLLMRQRTSLQPTSRRVRLMTESEYTVEHRNVENWRRTWPIALKIWKRKFA